MVEQLKRHGNLVWMGVLACLVLLSVLNVLVLSSCGGNQDAASLESASQRSAEAAKSSSERKSATGTIEEEDDSDKLLTTSTTDAKGVDYLVLVNKTHAIPDNWKDTVELVDVTNMRGTTETVESETLKAFEELQAALESVGITIDLNSCYRSRQDQQDIVDEFTVEYGEEYVREYVAEPGYSEHETGLALDVIPIVDGVELLSNEEMADEEELWDVVHTTMPAYGFILRYLPEKESITGYQYEPWHLRYVGKADAQRIAGSGLTLEEYLGAA